MPASPFLAGFPQGLLQAQEAQNQNAYRQALAQLAQQRLAEERQRALTQSAAGAALTGRTNPFGPGPSLRPQPPMPAGSQLSGSPAPQAVGPPVPAQGSPAASASPADPVQQMATQMFRQTNPQQIAQAIKEAKPDIDDQTLLQATQTLMTMGQSSVKADQIYALGLLRELGANQRAKLSSDTRLGVAETQEAGRAARSEASIGASNERFRQREERLRATGGAGAGAGVGLAQRNMALNRMRQELDSEIATETDPTKVRQLLAQRDRVMGEIGKIAGVRPPPNPVPQQDIPESGAAAALPPQE